MNIQDFKTEFDNIFATELQGLLRNAHTKLAAHPVKNYLDYVQTIGSHGKRIRPYNTALTYSIYTGKDWHDIKNTLVGIELIHLMALIHDDVMDDSDTRHGVTAAHTYIEHDLQSKAPAHLIKHTSQSLAVLIGDLIFAWAYTAFSKDIQTQDAWDIVHVLTEEVIIGQMMDVYNPIESSATMAGVENKMLLKTARYTFTHPLMLGAVLAGSKRSSMSWISDFGDSAGLLFQMQDDIFDFTKDALTLKKNPLGDIKNGVHTLLSVYIDTHATKEQKDTWSGWFGNKDTHNQEELNTFLHETGAFAFAEDFIKQKEEVALDAIVKSNLEARDADKVRNLLSKITHRTY